MSQLLYTGSDALIICEFDRHHERSLLDHLDRDTDDPARDLRPTRPELLRRRRHSGSWPATASHTVEVLVCSLSG